MPPVVALRQVSRSKPRQSLLCIVSWTWNSASWHPEHTWRLTFALCLAAGERSSHVAGLSQRSRNKVTRRRFPNFAFSCWSDREKLPPSLQILCRTLCPKQFAENRAMNTPKFRSTLCPSRMQSGFFKTRKPMGKQYTILFAFQAKSRRILAQKP